MAQVKVYVTLKPSLLDAQGKVVQGALQQLATRTWSRCGSASMWR